VKVLARALRSPRKRLVEALPEAYTALGGVGWEGFNFKTRKIEDMLVAGVIDSAIVGESVLVDAVSLGRMLLDISVCVVRASRNIENKKEIEQLSSQHKI
jgi:chaperonin GroEL (HSP60 family)